MLTEVETKIQTVLASAPCQETPRTETVTVTASFKSTLTNSQMDCTVKTETVTVLRPLETSNGPVAQSLKSDGSQVVWMVVVILLLAIAISSIVLSIFMGYLLHKRTKATSTVVSHSDNKETAEQGKVSSAYNRTMDDKTLKKSFIICG